MTMKAITIIIYILSTINLGSAFAPSPLLLHRQSLPSQSTSRFLHTNKDVSPMRPSTTMWNSTLRKIMAGTASVGALETAYLTYSKLTGYGTLCGVDGSCGDVLNSPYAVIHGTNIPLSALGCAAYTFVAMLAMAPILVNDDNDTNNRIALLSVATSMATFSSFLMAILFGVLHLSCPFCVASATLTWILGACAWFGGCLPTDSASAKQAGIQATMASVLATAVLAVAIFVNVDSAEASSPATLAKNPVVPQSPPPITNSSSRRALKLAKDLERMDARMFGAYWCSHCFDQKMTLGKEAFAKVQYIECAKEGENSQTRICKERNVPGYPTWEIAGKLYPGEQELDELEEIVNKIKHEQPAEVRINMVN